jgi:Putative zinc-finger
VRCSLLALSSYIDTELDLEPAGELEAHLVACDRCRTAIGHLREESARIGALARVHVPDDAVHELFSQIGLIAEEDDLPKGPVHRDRPASVEAPPWFGAERGAALPWAPRPSRHDPSQPRELIGERSPTTAVAEPPELLLWDETIDQIATTAPVPPPVQPAPASARAPMSDIEPQAGAQFEPEPAAHFEPHPPQIVPEPQPPDLSTSAPMATAPRLAAGPNAFHRIRDALAVRLALRRGAGSGLDSGVEIVSGTGAPRWNQRARPQHWSDSPPVVAAVHPAVVEAPLSQPPAVKPKRASRFMARVFAPAALEDDSVDVGTEGLDAPAAHATHQSPDATAPLDLADVLSEVASLAAPLERTQAPILERTQVPIEEVASPEATYIGEVAPSRATHIEEVAASQPAPMEDSAPSQAVRMDEIASSEPAPPADEAPAVPAFDRFRAAFARTLAPDVDTVPQEDETQFGVSAEPAAMPVPGRHVRRLHSQKSDRSGWSPTQPVTGRHVLPLGGPAVGAADRDRRLWVFGAVTAVVMVLGLLIGRQVTQTGPLVASTIPRSTPAVHASTPATAAPLPVATPTLAPTPVIPSAPTPQQLTSVKTLGTGSGGFSVADVRYGEHPNDFRLVFDMAFPDTVTGAPSTVIGYDGAITLYVEFTGVNGASNIASIPPGQVVASVVALPMVRNTGRLVFKITLRKHAPFDAYYLSGARLVIDVT